MDIDPAEWIDLESGNARDGAPLAAILSARAAIAPNRAALTIDFETLSFAELESRASNWAGLLLARGVTIGDRLAIMLPNGFDFAACTFAAWKIGAVPCPVSAKLLQGEREAILDLLQPAAIIAGHSLEAAPAPVIDASEAPTVPCAADLPPAAVSPNMKVLHSGGSTGQPKLIVDPGAAVWGPDKRGYRREEATVLSIPGPFYHTSPFMNVFCGIAQGSHVIAMSRFDPIVWLDQVERYRVAHAWLVPTMMARIAGLPDEELSGRDLSSIEMLVHVAAPCPPSVKRWWIDRIGADRVWEIYGGTERIGATFISGTEWQERPGSVGKANPGQEIVIRGEGGEQLPSGTIGEVWFRRTGAGPTYTYVGAESRAAGAMDSFGDMGWVDGDGYLYIADRRTDMFTVGGINIYPAEIENAISGLDGVLGCAVIGLPDADLGNRIHAIVEVFAGSPAIVDEAAFRARFEAVLPRGKQPHSIEFVSEALRDDAGKIRRSRLREERLVKEATQ